MVYDQDDDSSDTDRSSSSDDYVPRNDDASTMDCTDEHGVLLDIPNLSQEEFTHYVRLREIPYAVFRAEVDAGRRNWQFEPIRQASEPAKIGARIMLFRVVTNTSGQLEVQYNTSASTAMKYIAISHVWGTPGEVTRKTVRGVPWEVDLSPGKQDVLQLLSDELPSNGWFWMDIFCIDQRPTSPIPIAEQLNSIPEIYRSATCVKVLIESPICHEYIREANGHYGNCMHLEDMNITNYLASERLHARKCCSQLFLDPWWDRVWTRQEGLYALTLDFIFLKMVECQRYELTTRDADKYVTTSCHKLSQKAIRAFIDDKWAYHGLPPEDQRRHVAYLNLVVERRLDMRTMPGAETGPVAAYSPFESAWVSRRTTSKARDYVLAVLPDVPGYAVPTNAKTMSFPDLLRDAFHQLRSSCGYQDLIARIPECLLVAPGRSSTGIAPAICEAPVDISHAYDAFLPISGDADRTNDQIDPIPSQESTVVPGDIVLWEVSLTKDGVAEIADSYIQTCSYESFLAVPALSPCTGEPAPNIPLEEAMVFRYLRHKLIEKNLERQETGSGRLLPLPKVEIEVMEDATIVARCLAVKENPSAITVIISATAFAALMRTFLTCLVCGVTAESARAILEKADLKWVATPLYPAPALAVVRRGALDAGARHVLVKPFLSELRGYLVAQWTESGIPSSPIGRTWIPFNESDDRISSEMLEYISQGHFASWKAHQIIERLQGPSGNNDKS